ncbi:MAG TPA: thiamine pyrophosphate-dependent enzyme [Limnochordales bacterium]
MPRGAYGPDLVSPGLTTCEGCAMEIVARAMTRVLGPRTIVLTPPGCSAILTGFGTETGWKIPAFQSNLENAAAYMSGIRAGLDALGKDDVAVVTLAGDGGTVDIGLQALSGAVERGHRFIYICYDNEAYMNTGIQRSGATPLGAWTTTTPGGKRQHKKDIIAMLMAQGIPYIATASAGYIEDFMRKLERARQVDGPAYIHVHSPCPTGWRMPACDTVRVARLAVESLLWPLYEVVEGRLRVTVKVKEPKPVQAYLEAQGRFRGVSPEDAQRMQERAVRHYRRLLAQEQEGEA